MEKLKNGLRPLWGRDPQVENHYTEKLNLFSCTVLC